MIVVVVLLVPVSVVTASSVEPLEALPAELRTAIDAFYRAIETDAVETRVGLLAEDAVLMPDHWTLIEGKEAVAEVFRGGEGWVFRLRDREIVRAEVSGDLAYTVNSYFYTYHRADGEPQWHKTKNVHVWRRDDVGAWKLAVDIWNSDVGREEFERE